MNSAIKNAEIVIMIVSYSHSKKMNVKRVASYSVGFSEQVLRETFESP